MLRSPVLSWNVLVVKQEANSMSINLFDFGTSFNAAKNHTILDSTLLEDYYCHLSEIQ